MNTAGKGVRTAAGRVGEGSMAGKTGVCQEHGVNGIASSGNSMCKGSEEGARLNTPRLEKVWAEPRQGH